MDIYALIPDAEALLSLEPEELAGPVLSCLNSLSPNDSGQLHLGNFTSSAYYQSYPQQYVKQIQLALTEAWVWLEREGLIAPRPETNGFVFITRRGQRLSNMDDLQAYRKAALLPRTLLHPVIAQKAWAPFLRGDYDTAIFQSFKEVEVAVRVAGKFTNMDFGIDLMRKAFGNPKGPLADSALPEPEQQAMAHLFAGAIGSYKNPQSHRIVSINDPIEAVEMIMLASHLLRIVDAQTIV